MIGHKIIICGIDGAGKSTFINNFLKEHPEYNTVHCTRHTPNTYEYFKDLLLSEDKLIFDRFCYGQFVYQSLEERHLSLQDLYNLEKIIQENNFRVIYIYSDIETCLYNCKKDSEDSYYTEEYLKELDNKFRYLFSLSSVNIEYIYNDYHPITKDSIKEIDYKAFDYSSLPKIVAVDFDNCLVYGEKFPKIGHLNDKLVYDLFDGYFKSWKKILFTHRSGDSLIEACNFLADNKLYFDAVNDDIPEVKEALNRYDAAEFRKIWFDVFIDDKVINVWGYNDYKLVGC